MKIWIDFINSPQVCFFEPLITELSKKGHEFILTCRDSSNTVSLINQRGWKYRIIGNKAHRSLEKKLFFFPFRVFLLYRHLRNKETDIAICQSSFYVPIVAKLLGIRSIYTNDNEYAIGNIPSFYYANKIFVPENLSIEKIFKQGARKRKVTQYPGIKEGVYLWVNGQKIQSKRKANSANLATIYIRPEPSTAQYYSGKLNFLDNFLIELKEMYSVTILVRDATQLEHYAQREFVGIEVPTDPLAFEEVATNCLLFIGAGGTMTREMAMMGIPTISVYDGELLDVDRYLISKKLMIHYPDIKCAIVKDLLDRRDGEACGGSLMAKGKIAYDMFKEAVLNYSE